MVQGTMSNAGKSLLAAGLCRIFKQDGYRVAPFKSQNMALNSYITEDGLEMGRAQVVQAEAAGVAPDVRMNPILLKPTTDMGSQVIVKGEVLGNMKAREYYAYKPKLRKTVCEAYDSLAEEYDIIVIEGAGSPAEINLRADDFVNMGMAEIADAPVLLVGDIDRGGVFAQLIGTLILLEEDERARIKGLVINKFRGDITILDPGTKLLEEKSHKKVVGVVPYMQLDIEDEDSLSEHIERQKEVQPIDIIVISLPRISNFTDFGQFERMEGVSLRYVRDIRHFGDPDMIIIPGTKSTIDDLLWLRQNGLEALILKAAASGRVIFGVCGGFQMLGEALIDPQGVESKKTEQGLGLLPMDTVFTTKKVRTRVTGTVGELSGDLKDLSGVEITGYEIHMGVSKPKEEPIGGLGSKAANMTKIIDMEGNSKPDGCNKDNVYGTYVHGFFDNEAAARAVITAIALKKGIDPNKIAAVDVKTYKEEQYDKLAEGLRKSLDMSEIYRILGEDKHHEDLA